MIKPKFRLFLNGILVGLEVERWLSLCYINEPSDKTITFDEWLYEKGMIARKTWDKQNQLSFFWIEPETPEALTAFILKYF